MEIFGTAYMTLMFALIDNTLETVDIIRMFALNNYSFWNLNFLFHEIAMQSVINSVKGTALGVAEYLTPVLKVCLYINMISSKQVS